MLILEKYEEPKSRYWRNERKRTSIIFPSPLAKGRVIRLGTKNTGSHFANSVAPGLNTSYNPSPSFSFTVFKIIIEAKRAPQPAKLEGNGIEYFRNKDRNCVSRRMSMVVAATAFFFPVDDGAEAAAVAERAVRFPMRPHDGDVLRVNG